MAVPVFCFILQDLAVYESTFVGLQGLAALLGCGLGCSSCPVINTRMPLHTCVVLQDLAVYESTSVGLQGLAVVPRLFFLSCC
jgi:hypothetical protein